MTWGVVRGFCSVPLRSHVTFRRELKAQFAAHFFTDRTFIWLCKVPLHSVHSQRRHSSQCSKINDGDDDNDNDDDDKLLASNYIYVGDTIALQDRRNYANHGQCLKTATERRTTWTAVGNKSANSAKAVALCQQSLCWLNISINQSNISSSSSTSYVYCQ